MSRLAAVVLVGCDALLAALPLASAGKDQEVSREFHFERTVAQQLKNRAHVGLMLGSTWAHAGLNLGSTWAQPRLNSV